MPSSALGVWTSTRQEGLDRLVKTHATITNGRRGRRWETEHMNFALFTRLSAEFQGYCRDLHDESVDHIVNNLSASTGSSGVLPVTRSAFITGRALSKGNPNWGNLGSDFARIGVSLAAVVRAAHPAKYSEWVAAVDCLVDARNAIAHGNDTEIAICR